MKQVKIVLVGAGSASFGRGTIADLMAEQALAAEAEVTVTLVDTDESALETMFALAKRLREHYDTPLQLEATTDSREALPGADFVITAVARERNRLWAEDFHIPLAYGFKNPYGECGGPGAAFHTLRSLHLVLPICRQMEELCPEALLLNFTNPESRVCLGVTQLTSIRCAGLCHGAASTLGTVARILGRETSEVELTVGGVNHFHWALGIADAATGADLLPEFNQRLEEDAGGLEPLTRFLYDTYGLLPFPSDSHIAEYVSFGYEFVGPHYLAYNAAREERKYGIELSPMERIRQAAESDEPLPESLSSPSGEWAVSIISDVVLDRGGRQIAVNVPNEGPAISNLPPDAIVEVPARVDAGGIHPLPVGPLPESIAALCQRQIAIQNLLVAAYAESSKQLLLQALLLEPIVDDTRRAAQMMQELLSRQAAYLPELR